MIRHPYAELAAEYQSWVATVRPLPDRVHEIDSVARRLTRPEALAKFAAVEVKLGIPQVVQAAICEREDGCDFTKNPGQGDSLNHPSIHVPKGRPPLGEAPNDRFPVTWEYAAIDAFSVCDRLNDNSAPWSLPYACWKWEGYNGLGPRAHGRRTGYVVGGTNLQQPGKYIADGVWDPNHWDTQLGTLPIAMRMIELVPSLAFGQAVAMADAPSIIPAVQPVPTALAGSLTGVRWVQASLNTIEHIRLDVDGNYGRQTRAAIRVFQQMVGLPDNGLVDDALCNALDAKLAAMRPLIPVAD